MEMNGWVNVAERLPEIDQDVLTINLNLQLDGINTFRANYLIETYNRVGKNMFHSEIPDPFLVTHWHIMPELPKEVIKE